MKFLFNIFCISITVLTFSSCKKHSVDDWKTIKKLYRIYKNGEISECKLNGNKVFSAGLSAYDAGGSIYDKDGNTIGNCNYAWGSVDSICGQLKDCETVYRIKENIWGQPAIDKYKISNRILK